MAKRELKTPPIVPGGIYRREYAIAPDRVETEYATMVAVQSDRMGTLMHFRRGRTEVNSDPATPAGSFFSNFTLVYAPELWPVEKHVEGVPAMSPQDEEKLLLARMANLKREAAELERKNAALAAK